jgi:hypothetical protein
MNSIKRGTLEILKQCQEGLFEHNFALYVVLIRFPKSLEHNGLGTGVS